MIVNTMNSFGSNSLTGGGLFIHTPLCSTLILVVKLKKEILDLSCYVTLIEKIPPFLLSLKCTALSADLHENVRNIFLLIVKLYSLYVVVPFLLFTIVYK